MTNDINDNQENSIEKDTFVLEENTEINLPPAPNFDAATAAPVQPVIPVAAVPGETLAAYGQQPQVVYVPQPVAASPSRSWTWIPAALVLLLIATVAGAYVGAALYQRSTYAAPHTSEDVSPYADLQANENNSDKTNGRNETGGKESAALENGKSGNVKTSESKEFTSISNGFAPVQRVDSRTTKNDSIGGEENAVEENDQEREENAVEENDAVNTERQQASDDEDAPPPVKQKAREMPRKVENKKDTENIAPPQREMPY
jgi:hypothetical protein